MRVMDEKGRLFGLVNAFDLAVVLGAVLLAAAAWVYVSGPRGGGVPTGIHKPVEVELRMIVDPSDEWICRRIEQENPDWGVQTFEKETGTPTATLVKGARLPDGRYEVVLRVRGERAPEGLVTLHGFLPRIGARYRFRNDRYELPGRIASWKVIGEGESHEFSEARR